MSLTRRVVNGFNSYLQYTQLTTHTIPSKHSVRTGLTRTAVTIVRYYSRRVNRHFTINITKRDNNIRVRFISSTVRIHRYKGGVFISLAPIFNVNYYNYHDYNYINEIDDSTETTEITASVPLHRGQHY